MGGVFLIAVALLFVAFSNAVPQAVAACPNEALRAEQESTLPDCRAYELVTPPGKGSGEPEAKIFLQQGGQHESEPLSPRLAGDRLRPAPGARAALDGERIGWITPQPLAQSPSPGASELSTRTAAGWTSQGLVPPMSPFNDIVCAFQMGVSGWSPDLTRAILDLPAGPPQGFHFEEECGHPEPRLVPGEPERLRNLYVHDNLGGSNALVNVTPATVLWPVWRLGFGDLGHASFVAGSNDLSHVVFTEELPLTEAAEKTSPEVETACENRETGCWEGQNNLYEWSGGEVRLVTVLPGDIPVLGDIAGDVSTAQARHAISADGSRIFFEAGQALYLRESGTRTVQVDESQGPGASGGGTFMVASSDGSRVLFTSDHKLTTDSGAESGKPDLYEYNVESGGLTDRTVASEPADVLGVSGASEEGSRVYFVATGVLSAVPNSNGDSPIAGAPNLYLSDGGAIDYVATLEPTDDRCDWLVKDCVTDSETGLPNIDSGLTSRVSRDGRYIAFNSVLSPTGYDNRQPESGESLYEIYRYDAASHELACASCKPSGAPPKAGAAILWPAPPGNYAFWENRFIERNISDSGQVFFETADALLPRDVNGRSDVYEYAVGEPHLLSSGTGETGTYFIEATPDGHDVFIATGQRLLPRDVDTAADYYDARVGGGFPEPPSPPPSCGGADCHPATALLEPGSEPATGAFRGKGNLRKRASCRATARHARRLSHRARVLRKRAAKLRHRHQGQRAMRSSRRAKRLSHRARRLNHAAKRCRRSSRRSGR
jgi:hypothetical protein